MELIKKSGIALVLVVLGVSFCQADQYNGIPLIPGAAKGKEIIDSAYYERFNWNLLHRASGDDNEIGFGETS